MLGCVALVVDIGYLYHTRAQLQNAADAAALAGITEIREGGGPWAAEEEAATVAAQNQGAGKSVKLDGAQDVAVGTYDWQQRKFKPGAYGQGSPAVKVTARRTAGSPDGEVNLFFAPILGRNKAGVAAEAVAALHPREVVICQDCTYSFLEEIEDAKVADFTLVATMNDQQISGDRVGLVRFTEVAQRVRSLTPLPEGMPLITSAISGLYACSRSSLPNCAGTHTGAGIREAIRVFQDGSDPHAERVIVLVSDGMPYPASRRQPAIDAANEAAAAGISIFAVTLTHEAGGQYGVSGSDAKFNASLVRGFGRAYDTPDSEELASILATIMHQIPGKLVE
jgi:hypothetical protein